MKPLIAALYITLPALAFAQTDHLKIKNEPLSSRDSFGAMEILNQKDMLDQSLSDSLKSDVLRSSEPYTITNMSEIQGLIDNEKTKLYPDFRLSMHTFEGSAPVSILVNRIDTIRQRHILRGEVYGLTGSQVKLVVYDGKMSGRIIFSDQQKVLVIRSINGGISANYEVDTRNITYN